jgi:hypothetical protein
VTQRPVAHQRAVFAESPPSVRSELWVEAPRRAQEASGVLSGGQLRVFERAIELAHDERLFTADRAPDPALDGQLVQLREEALEAFPDSKTRRLLLSVGQLRPAAGRPG